MNARLALALVLVLLLPGIALSQVRVREGGFGDKVTGDIHFAGETDLYMDHAVEGSTLTVKVVPKGRTSYQTSLALYESLDNPNSLVKTGILLKNGRGFKSLPINLPLTGLYRLVIGCRTDEAGNPFAGTYALKTKVRPPTKFDELIPFPAGGGEAEMKFQVLAGSRAKIVVKGGPGTLLPNIVDVLGPDGTSYLAGALRKDKKRSVLLKNLTLPDFGEYRLVVAGEGSGSFRGMVKIKPPRSPGLKILHLDGSPPRRNGVLLGTISNEPYVQVEDEAGGANDFFHAPGQGAPIGIPLETGVTALISEVVFEGDTAVGYTWKCNAEGWGGVVTELLFDEDDLMAGFRAALETPLGNGIAFLGDVERDPDNKHPLAWTEERTFDSGDSWTFRIRSIFRVKSGNQFITKRFLVDVTRPDGTEVTVALPPWALEEE